MKDRGPLVVAIVLLVLPMIYVGSYFALVVPRGYVVVERVGPNGVHVHREHYRWGEYEDVYQIKAIYWPLEQIDRRIRHVAWDTLSEI